MLYHHSGIKYILGFVCDLSAFYALCKFLSVLSSTNICSPRIYLRTKNITTMDNSGIASNSEENNQEENTQPENTNADASIKSEENATTNKVSALVIDGVGDGVAVADENVTDNTATVETMNADASGDDVAKEDTDTDDVDVDAGAEAEATTKLKSEETVEEIQGNLSAEEKETPDSPVKTDNDDANVSEDPSAAVESKKETPSSPPSEPAPATTDDVDDIKTEPVSPPKEDGAAMDVENTTPVVAAPAVSENQDDTKEDSKSPEQVMKEEDAISMVVEDSSEPPTEPDVPLAVEESFKAPATETSNTNSNTSNTTTYSTRGRSTEAAAVEEKPERIHIRDTFEESPHPNDPPLGVSFLVEAMTEEERRTRTRFLPDVDGMNMLRKNEIKDDLALAMSLPSIVSPQGLLQTRTGRLGSVSGRSDDSMDVDGDETTLAIHDESTTTITLPSSTLTIPSDAFVAPKGVVVGDADSTLEVKDFEPALPSPSIVESVMSFNPPRPPESVGGKKKHRMIRWERRPEDIEVDMKNYRRTVQRTRQELQKSEAQYERLEMVDAHLRHHFLNHSKLLDQEYSNIQDQSEVEVEKLMKESDLIGSRTRSRNLTKIDVVMRDVLTMLTRNEQKDSSMDGLATEEVVSSDPDFFPGVGGLNSQAFIDWERSTELKSMSPCISWIEPGQKVTTPQGEGTVIAIIPPESPPANDSATNSTANNNENKSEQKTKMSEDKLICINDKKKYDALLPLRVKVQLEDGVGVFVVSSITKMESPAHFTDAKLAKRWKGMIDSALEVGPCIDLQGMIPDAEETAGDIADFDKESSEVSSTDAGDNSKSTKKTSASAKTSANDFLTVGASLVPTKFGRGNFLHNMKICDIEDTLQNVLYGGHGVLGRVSCEKENTSIVHNCLFNSSLFETFF